MEAFPLVILALFILVALMFYERSRRADVRSQGDLSRRISGGSTPTRGEAFSAEAKAAPQQTAYTLEYLRPLERWLAQAGLELPVQQFLGLTLLTGVAGLLLTGLWLNFGIACFYGAGIGALPAVY